MEAVNAKNVEISAYLISEGADVNFMGIFTPLYCAVAANTPALVQLLLASGAHPDGHTKASCPFIPLCIAAHLGYLDIAQVLVEGSADIHMRGPRPKNMLLECTNIELLRFFLERGVDPNNEDRDGNTTLHTVCGKWHAEYGTAFIELLCQFGAVPDKTNSILRTTVDFALTNGLPHIVEIVEPYVQTPALQARISRWWERRKKAET
jgi:ankyrin repeat protein